MEKKIYCTFLPSLEHRTLTKVAVTLWNKDDIRVLLSRNLFERYILPDKWENIQNEVVENVSKLLLPKPLKEKLLYFVRFAGLEIRQWVIFHNSIVKKLPGEFFWTAQGTIDKEKTAEILVNDESLDIHERYKLACTSCLEDHIRVLWEQLRKYPCEEDLAYDRLSLVSFWSHYLEGKIDQLHSIMKRYCGDDNVTPYEYAFRRSALTGNEAATRYFLRKLTPEEKEKILVRTAGDVVLESGSFWRTKEHTDFPDNYYTDVLCILLLQMDEGQQIEVFKSHPYEVLKCFLDWPRQSFFMKMAEHVWDFLSEKDYYRLLWLDIIHEKVIKGHGDFNYRKLFREFWQQSPGTHKKYAINQCMSGDLLLCVLFEFEDEESIKLIFKDAIAAEREKCIFRRECKILCHYLIFNGKWDFLKFFVKECISSEDVIIRLKEEFKEYIVYYCSKETLDRENDMWNKFFRLLNDFMEKDDKKRSLEEVDSNLAKRICS